MAVRGRREAAPCATPALAPARVCTAALRCTVRSFKKMSKEMVISANPHETRVAIMEEGQLCEYYVERQKEFALVGSIYKGRVTRVLPGMQSAFVEIGLDSDAFLYVSDFMEDVEDLDTVVSTAEEKIQKIEA